MYELALVQETGLLCVMFAVVGLPLKDDDNEKVNELAKRLSLLFDDALVLMRKHALIERFKL